MGDTASTDEWIYHTSSTEVLIAKSWFLPYEDNSVWGGVGKKKHYFLV